MQTGEIVIENASGLHARPGKLFVERAARWTSSIRIENLTRGTGPVDAKSILGLLTLGAARGHRIRLTATGMDETEALADLVGFVGAGLGEAAGAA